MSPISVFSILTRLHPPIYCVSWKEEKQQLKEETECLVMALVIGVSNKPPNIKWFKHQPLKSTVGVPNWGESLSRGDLKAELLLSCRSLILINGIQGCSHHLQKPVKREMLQNIVWGRVLWTTWREASVTSARFAWRKAQSHDLT